MRRSGVRFPRRPGCRSAIDVIERQRRGQQLVHRQAPFLEPLDVQRNVASRVAAAEIAAFDGALFSDDADLRDAELGVGGRQAGRHRRAAAPRDLVGQIERLDRAGHFKGEIHASARGFTHLAGAIGIPGTEDVGGPELPGQGQLRLGQIDRDQHSRLQRPRTQQRGETHPAESDDGDAGIRRHPRRVDHCAHAGDHGTAEHGGLIERQRAVDAHERPPRDGGYCAKAETPR